MDVPNSAGVAADIDGGKTSVQSLVSVNGSFTVGELTIDAGDGIFITQGSRLTLAGSNAFTGAGTLANSGSVTFEGLTYQSFLILSGSVTLTGGGTITLIPGSQIQGDNVTLTNVDNTIEGYSGGVGDDGILANNLTIINQAAGVINANVSGKYLTVNPRAGTLTNSGLLVASNGGILDLDGGYGSTFTNVGAGTMQALDGSTLLIRGSTVVGGTLLSAGTGTILVNSKASLTNVINAGAIVDTDGDTTTLTGTLTNRGTIVCTSTEGIGGTFTLNGNVTLNGGGSITLVDRYQINGTGTLTNVDNTIEGFTPNGGGIGGNQIAIVNGAAGVINANVSGQTLTVDPGNGGLTNAGLMEATGGGILFLSGNYNQTFTNQGEFRVNDGSTVNASQGIVANLANGTLTGGTYTVLSTTTAATTLSFGGGNITTNAATIVLSGANSVFADLGALSDNRGSLALLALRQFTTAGALSNEGTLKIDAGSTLHVVGGFTGSSASTLAFTIGGTQSQGVQSAGVLQVNGTATLNGALTVSLGAGAQISTSSTITILAAAGGVSGRFTNVPNGERLGTADGTGSFQVNYGPDSAFSTSGVVLSGFVSSGVVTHPSFFTGEVALSNGVYYLAFPTGSPFGYYSYLSDPHYLYHFDLGYEYVFDAADGNDGVYLYDFKSQDFFYTAPRFPFPYLYDFNLKTVLYYYPDPKNAGHYNTNGVRYFYDFATGKIISK